MAPDGDTVYIKPTHEEEYLRTKREEAFNDLEKNIGAVTIDCRKQPCKTRPNVKHYQQGKIEPIDFIISHDMNFNLGNAVKYITRCNHKGTKQDDLKKAIDYLNFELERL